MKKTILAIAIVIVAFILISIVAVQGTANRAISLEENVSTTKSDIDTQLQRRVNVLTELAECVQTYDEHEYKTLLDVISVRGANDKDATVTKDVIAEINAVAEAYPNLKSDGNYKQLMTEISVTENLIQQYRSAYNKSVKNYNRYVRKFPSKQFLDIAGYEVQSYEYYKTEAKDDQPMDLFR